MQLKTIAFDCDGTLKDYNSEPRPLVIAMLRAFVSAGWLVVVWSGGGAFYADQIARQLGIDEIVTTMAKTKELKPDIAVDDEEVNLGTLNIKV